MIVSKESKAIDRAHLITAIRTAAAACPGKRLAFRKFRAASKISMTEILRHFTGWHEALCAAGFNFKRPNALIKSARLLEDWGRVARQSRRLPTVAEYKKRGKHGLNTVLRRFGTWSKVPDAFRDFAARSRQWANVLPLLPPQGAPNKTYRRKILRFPGRRARRGQRPAGRFSKRPVCGPPLDFCGLRHAPANEWGVVFLFGAMARDLGFLVESLQPGFPDCEAKRLTGIDTWQSVRIEFEYESRNFRDHGHDPGKCDVIVCWNHNWPECPENLEVIALNEHIGRFAAALVPEQRGCAGSFPA